MSKREKTLEEMLVSRLLRLNAAVLALVSGLFLGLGLFVATNWLVLKGGTAVGPHLALLGEYFVGYRVTFAGSLIGLFYGFIVGYAGGYLVAILYNRFVDLKERRRPQDTDRPAR